LNANHRDFPSWGYMLENGATTLWESWAYPDNGGSQNHPMFGSINEWFYRSILGINPAAPGFKKIIIKPEPAGDLSWAKGSFNSVYGKIVSDWQLQGDKFLLKVTIPANTEAELWIPDVGDAVPVELNGVAIGAATKHDKYQVVHVGSGNYAFQSTYK
jgi:alpha-L-rhamnosidase